MKKSLLSILLMVITHNLPAQFFPEDFGFWKKNIKKYKLKGINLIAGHDEEKNYGKITPYIRTLTML